MSYTSWKRKLVPGAELSLINLRRPWRSRKVFVVEVTKRFVLLCDEKDYARSPNKNRIELPPAAFTKVIDDDTVAFLATEDGPAWATHGGPTIGTIPAGTPWLRVKVLSDGS